MKFLKCALVLSILLFFLFFPSCSVEPVPTPYPVNSVRPFVESNEFSWWLRSVDSWEDLKEFILNCEGQNDEDLFGVEDYWQTPDEFFHSRAGDCDCFSWFIAYVWIRKLEAYRAYVVWIDGQIPSPHAHMYAVIEKTRGQFTTINYENILGTVDSIEKTKDFFHWPDCRIVQVSEVTVQEETKAKKIEKNFGTIHKDTKRMIKDYR